MLEIRRPRFYHDRVNLRGCEAVASRKLFQHLIHTRGTVQCGGPWCDTHKRSSDVAEYVCSSCGERLNLYKKSSPIPTWNPRLDPSLLLATSGTPKLASTLTGSKRYISPTPADIDGFDMVSTILSLNDLAMKEINQMSKCCQVPSIARDNKHLCIESSLPALTNMCALTGQWPLFGMLEMRLTPADQCVSPPNESAIFLYSRQIPKDGRNTKYGTYVRLEDPCYSLRTTAH